MPLDAGLEGPGHAIRIPVGMAFLTFALVATAFALAVLGLKDLQARLVALYGDASDRGGSAPGGEFPL